MARNIKRPYERPTAAQHRQMRDWLETQGFSRPAAAQAIGAAPNGRAIGTIADELRINLRALPAQAEG